jgi:hypothetical protein
VPRRPQDFDALIEYFTSYEEHFDSTDRPGLVSVPADISGAHFEYRANDWAAIEVEIAKLPSLGKSEPKHWRLNLESLARAYFLMKASAPPVPLSERMRQWETVWRKIGELEDAILDAAESHFEGVDPPKGAVEDIDEQLESLHNFRRVVASRAAELKPTVISSYRPQVKSARAEYCRAVVAAWRAWGGESKRPASFSRQSVLSWEVTNLRQQASGTSSPRSRCRIAQSLKTQGLILGGWSCPKSRKHGGKII